MKNYLALARVSSREQEREGLSLKGTHQPIIDRSTFGRVQTLLGEKHYNAHDSVYGGGMVTCKYCGSPVVVEIKTKQTKAGEREYRYYRCAHYTRKGHPRHRVTEAKLDTVILDLFDKLADIPEKRRILEILCLNFFLDDVSLCPVMRKPFDALAKGLSVQSGRGDKI